MRRPSANRVRLRIPLAALLAALLAVAAAGCVPAGGFVCEDDEQCVAGGGQGTCEAVGYCSFADPDCPGGRRFGDRARADLAGACVGGGLPADASLDDSSGDPDGDAAGDVVASFGEGDGTTYTGVTRDTWIQASSPDVNHGGGSRLEIDGEPLRSATLRFELSALPPTAVIAAAELEVHTMNGAPPDGTIELYALLEAWSEGTVDGAVGAASWTERLTGTPWTTAGAGAPGSRAAAASGSFTPASSNSAYAIALPAALVQSWVATPSDNHGVVFIAAALDAGVRLGSAQGTADRRPKLTVRYRPAAP